MKTGKRHFESMYIVLADTGSFILSSYRPTDSYSGRRGSDLSSLYTLPYVEGVSHDMTVGDTVVICRDYFNVARTAKQKGMIVVKLQRFWDYSMPIGNREEVVFKSEKWDEYMGYYKNQKI